MIDSMDILLWEIVPNLPNGHARVKPKRERSEGIQGVTISFQQKKKNILRRYVNEMRGTGELVLAVLLLLFLLVPFGKLSHRKTYQ